MRYVPSIGMYAIDRGRTSCRWRTHFCTHNCYNVNLYRFRPAMAGADARIEQEWHDLWGADLKAKIQRVKSPVKRFRLCTRGEPFSEVSDVLRVRSMLVANPDVLFWIPTRAWRDPRMRRLLITDIFDLPNARLMASIDPSNDPGEVRMLEIGEWSTIYFGDDTETAGRFKCPKTWQKKDGHCARCRKGCFSKKQVHVHLKQH